jgi:hypothetical protein
VKTLLIELTAATVAAFFLGVALAFCVTGAHP